jgi:site-specific DNA-methyltransferase (adenine-specific)
VYGELDREFHFSFDPCPLNSTEDGLKLSWSGTVFCNPPYSKIQQFIKKGLWHIANGDAKVLCYLLPARTDTAWFHDFCLKATEIRFLRGRLKFGNAVNSAPFPSMVVIFREWLITPTPIG